MSSEDEFPAGELGDGRPNDPSKKEGDEQDQEFMDRLKHLSDQAEANAEGRQANFDFPEEGEEDEPFNPAFAGDVQNPKEAYDLYYTIRRLLMQGLPGGRENQALRQMVYDEKNLYLRNGVDRPLDGSKVGADSRQALLSFLREAFTKTQDWARRGGAAYDIFLEYYELNKKMKFR
jgi:hypothetical protein